MCTAAACFCLEATEGKIWRGRDVTASLNEHLNRTRDYQSGRVNGINGKADDKQLQLDCRPGICRLETTKRRSYAAKTFFNHPHDYTHF